MNSEEDHEKNMMLAICILANKSCSWDNLFLYLITLFGFRELYLLS